MRKSRTKADFINNLDKALVRFGVMDRGEILSDFEQHFADSAQNGMSEAEICEKLGDITEIAKQYGDDYIFPAVAVSIDDEEAEAIPEVMEKEIVIPNVNEIIMPVMPEINTVNTEITSPTGPLVLDDISEIEELIKAAPAYDESLKTATWQNEQSVPQEAPPPAETHQYQAPPPEVKYTSYENSGITFKLGGLIKVLVIDLCVLSWALPALAGVIIGYLSIPVSLITSGLGSVLNGATGVLSNFFAPFSGITGIFFGIMVTSIGGLLALLGVKMIKGYIGVIKGVINWHGVSIVGKPVFKGKEKKK